MFKTRNKLLALLLAIALVTTTFGTDLSGATAYAVEESEGSEEDGITTWGEIKEDVEAPEGENSEASEEAGEPSDESGQSDESSEKAGNEGTPEAPEETAADQSSQEASVEAPAETPTEDASSAASSETAAEASGEASTEDAAEASSEASSEDASEASSEASSEDAAAAASSEEAEEKTSVVTVTYEIADNEGGSLSKKSETVDLEDEEQSFEGSTATADEGYKFVKWTTEDGSLVTEKATIVPSDIEEDTTFVAVFEKEVKMPAVSFNEHANGLNIVIDAPEGAFPEGTKAEITPVFDDAYVEAAEGIIDGEAKTAIAVDISFKYDGEEIEPLIPISVKMFSDVIETADNTHVVHINDDGEANLVGGVNVGDESLGFVSGDFSIYIVVIEGYDSRLEVKFMNGTKEIASMYVKKRDVENGKMDQVLYDPGAGELEDGVIFKGWTRDPKYTKETTGLTIEDVRKEVEGFLPPAKDAEEEGAEPVVYYAMLFKEYHVTYLDEKYVALGQHSALYRADATGDDLKTDYTINMGYSPVDDEHDFQGWFVYQYEENVVELNGSPYVHDPTKSYINGTKLVIQGELVLAVNSPEGHWLVFDENGKGATYCAPQFVESNKPTAEPRKPEDMHRKGYTFDGWWTGAPDKVGGTPTGEKFVFGDLITEKTTLYAKWIPDKTAPYTIIIWKQSAAKDGSYDFADSCVGEGLVGANIKDLAVEELSLNEMKYVKVNVTRNDITEEYQFGGIDSKAAKGPKANDPFIGFTQNTDKTNSDVEITPEGDAVLNIYFDRMHYNLKMIVARQNGNRYQGSHLFGNKYSGDWASSLDGVTLIDGAAPSNTFTDGGYTYYYYLISADYGDDISGVWPGYDNVKVVNDKRYFISWLLMEDAKAFTGTSGGKDTVKGEVTIIDEMIIGDLTRSDANYLTARYDDEPYTWTYKIFFADDKGNYPATPNQTVEAKSNQYTSTSQHNPAIEGYEFVKQDNYKADLNKKICEISFYYKPLTYPIRFMDGQYINGDNKPMGNHSENMLHVEKAITYGANIQEYLDKHPGEFDKDNPESPEPGYVFLGWYLDKACEGAKFDFNTTMPLGGVIVYAKWIQIQYRVFLHPNAKLPDGTNDECLYWGSDTQSMCFRVDYNGKIDAPHGLRQETNYIFKGWYLDEACSHDKLFNAESYKLNEDTVTATYDKVNHLTDTMDKFGELIEGKPKYNADVDRPWITKEFHLYGLWGKVLDGADGVKINYELEDPDLDNDPLTTDPGKGEGKAKDDKTYADASPVSAAPAVKAPKGYQFDCWIMQTYDKTAGKYVDTEERVLPGAVFTVNSDYAKVEPHENGVNKIYTIQLRAEYKPVDDPTPTYIPWFNNDGTKAFHIDTLILETGESKLGINEAVVIQNPTNPVNREKYEFKGWAKVKMGTSDEQAKAFMANSDEWLRDLEVNFLWYKDGDYYPDATFDPEHKAKKVAADEMTPYEALFAVWEELPGYEVKYEISGDIPEGKTAPVDSNKYVAGEKVTVLSIGEYPEGYKFEGWTTKDVDGTEQTYAADATFNMPENDVTLHGVFSLEKYKVTFSFDESAPSGLTPPDAILDVPFKSDVDVTAQTAAVTAAAKAVGYEFLGWTPKQTDFTFANDQFKMPAHDVELIGKFKLREDVEYTVLHFYEKEDGSFPDDPKYTDNKSDGKTGDTLNITLLLKEENGYRHEPTKDEYLAGGAAIEAPVVQGDGSLVIKLYYILPEFTVTYKYDDSAPSNASALPADKNYKVGVDVKYEPEASAEGYKFLGWKVQGEDITTIEGGFVMPARNVVVIGSFEILEFKVSYEFDSTKPAADIAEPADQTGLHFQDPVSTEDATKFVNDQKDKFSGYTFLGWKVKEGLTGQDGYVGTFTMPANDVVLIGSFAGAGDIEYKVEYYFEKEDKKGEYDHDTTLDATKNDGVTGQDLTADQLSSLQKAFAGFTYEKSEYAASTGDLTKPTVQADGSLVVKLYYVRREYKVTYIYVGKVPDDATKLPEEATYRFGVTVEVAKDAEAKGYKFSGWSGNYQEEVNGSLIDKIISFITGEDKKTFTMPAADVIIQGSFEGEKFEVSYKIVSDEIPSGIVVPETKTYAVDEVVYVESELAAKGYAFAGWVSKTIAPEGGQFKMPAENVEFIGVFDPITYEITFEYRVADGVTPPANLDELQEAARAYNGTFRAGEDIPLPTRPTISGYVFTAWKMEEVTNEEGHTPFDRALERAKQLLALKVSAAEGTMKCQEYDAVIYSVINASVTPPDPPTPTPDPPTPTPTPGPTPDPTPIPTPTPTPTPTPGQAVLGARRETGNGQAVLGARRGKTDDETNTTARAFAIIVAAAAAISLFFVGKKKEEEEEG